MTEGNRTFLGGGVPLEGESEIFQKEATIDILTITGKSGQSGDFLVLQNSGGSERFVIDKDGNIDAPNLSITGTFGVTGATTLTGALTQSTGSVTIKGAVTHASTLHQTGAATLAGALTMTGGTGDIVLKKGAVGQTAFSKLQLAVLNTSPTTTTLLSRGDLWIQKATTDIWQIACYLGPTTAPLMMRMRKDTFVSLGSAS